VPSGTKTELNDVGGEGDDVISASNVEGSGEEVEDVVDHVSRGFEAESAAVQRARSVVISRRGDLTLNFCDTSFVGINCARWGHVR
jgi:hypothetical protein